MADLIDRLVFNVNVSSMSAMHCCEQNLLINMVKISKITKYLRNCELTILS